MNNLNFEDRIEKLNQMIIKHNKIVFFGGAGVSTESGIPDFRSKDGLYHMNNDIYKGKEPEYLLSRECLFNEPKLFFSFYRNFLDTRKYEPNIAHNFLAKLEQNGKDIKIVTQNIDGLHQKAGSKKVYEIHGTTLRNYCHKCKKEYDSNYIFENKDNIPKCNCNQRGIIRPDVTLYSEALPKDVVKDAIKAIQEADMLIIAGASLKVQPAASFISYFEGEDMVIINREKTDIDNWADLSFKEDIGEVFRNLSSI